MGIRRDFVPAAGVALLLALSAGSAAAQDKPSPDEIVVTGFVQAYRLTAAQLRNAAAAYARNRAALAPAGSLLFEVRRRDGSEPGGDVRLWLRAPRGTIAIALDDHGRFPLPALTDASELVTNRARGTIGIRPIILSPGTAPDDRRLGDLRLQCIVGWAIAKDETSIAIRGMFDLAGGCRSSRFGFYARSARAIDRAAVTEGRRSVPIAISSDRHTYRLPLADRSLSNEARVRFSFADPPSPTQH